MADGMVLAAEAAPYTWDASQDPPSENVLTLWTEVGNGIDKSQTVVWKNAVESLQSANQFLTSSQDARLFVEKYMLPIISILVEQQPTKIGPHERSCVQESLALAVTIIARDIEIQVLRNGDCVLLDVLGLVFNKKKAYYKGNKGNWNNHMSGLPEVRLKMIERFRLEQGFSRLQTYLTQRIGVASFPSLDLIHHLLAALADVIQTRPAIQEQAAALKDVEDCAIGVAQAVMQYISSCSDDTRKRFPPEAFHTMLRDLQRIFDKLISLRRDSTCDFYRFWRDLVLKLIKSASLPLRLFGWQQMDEMLEACVEHRPPPRFFEVSKAGSTFVNGRYSFTGAATADGYAMRGSDISYERVIPEGEEGAGKKLTLFRCTMRSQQKWWFLSEADEEQPGTDRDIDYYQHKSKEHEEMEPPQSGWVTCRNSGTDPPPLLRPIGLMVPAGEEFNTLEHQLAQWAIENDIIELVLGDSVHREIVSRSTPLIKFLASMCERDSGIESSSSKRPNQYCLQFSHLLLAWKTCSRKTDAAVSAQIYQLLVSILPSCPSNLSIPLLKQVQDSVCGDKEKGVNLNEVADFCAALAAANSSDAKAASTIDLEDDVRTEVLELLWSVLTHPDAASLKVYDTLKGYVTNELRVEPKGSEHRERYLASCVRILTENSKLQTSGTVDEAQALRMVKLTHFVLVACPREQASKLVSSSRGALPKLIFEESVASLQRRQHESKSSLVFRKSPSSDTENRREDMSLSERLHILRYAFGLSEDISMSSQQLHRLWQLCELPRDREELMIFLASASTTGHTNNVQAAPVEVGPQQANVVQPDDVLSAAFSEEVCVDAFLNLFCSSSVTFQFLGVGAYQSFQYMYNRLRMSPASGEKATAAAIDALWRICLGAGNDGVASQAMKDLLAVYITYGGENGLIGGKTVDIMDTEPSNDHFGSRVFQCLSSVKQGLDSRDPSATLAAERCLRILNAAIGQTGTSSSITQSTLGRLAALSTDASLQETVSCLPHGMRGQACYFKINVMAKRAQNSQNVQTQHDQTRNQSTARFSIDVHPLETLRSVKTKVAAICDCPALHVKPVSVSGRLITGGSRGANTEQISPANLASVPDDSVVDELGLHQGSEIVFLVTGGPQQAQNSNHPARANRLAQSQDLSDMFCGDNQDFPGKLFEALLDVLASVPETSNDSMNDENSDGNIHKLVWDLLLALPTNARIAEQVQSTAKLDIEAMEVDNRQLDVWPHLLSLKNFHRSVYMLLAIDAFLEPAVEVLSTLPPPQRVKQESETIDDAIQFRKGFIQSGGFDSVVNFFSSTDHPGMSQSMARMGNAVALRILKCCLFGNATLLAMNGMPTGTLDETGNRLMQSLTDANGLLQSLAAMVVKDTGISTSTISDILKFLKLLFGLPKTAENFVSLPDAMPEKFLVSLLLWDENTEASRINSAVNASLKVRKSTYELITSTPILADYALPWLTGAVETIETSSDSTVEFFDTLLKLVAEDRETARSKSATKTELQNLSNVVCTKLATCPRMSSENAAVDSPTGVLCGCLGLLRAIIEVAGGTVVRKGTSILLESSQTPCWSKSLSLPSKGMFSIMSQFRSNTKPEDAVLIDLMGVIFDGFLSPGSSSEVAICCDKDSRQRGFDVIGASARHCEGPGGYLALVSRLDTLITSAAPYLKHRWGQIANANDGQARHLRNHARYSGLRNQGCTCYMNSFLQQMFMMPELRNTMCSAPLPASLRSSSGVVSAKGTELVGKKVAMQWENGVSYDAVVENFDKSTGMHTIRYCSMPVATVSGSTHQQVQPEDIARLPDALPEEFLLAEGRPGKETGLFDVVDDAASGAGNGLQGNSEDAIAVIKESEDEAASRHLMEEVQRTFIHLEEGSRGRCFDPRALVEASACLKLEFDVWQQNDASEFATKLLDRLEITLKKWAPNQFRYLDHTFGLKQTKQKICKECGLKTNREEKLLNVDCQIRGKADIHEALASMTEVEIMEGDNQVFCDRCKKNTDTILRTAISTLPNMLILSLKRFDLDFTTFETVKLNSRCAFGQSLNMKQYTLEGLEEMETETKEEPADEMDTETDGSGPRHLNDEDYEYKLAGVLVHAGVAQGGHYYSFIKDRSQGSEEEKWYRFDDEDVTPFDPAMIETECFGGKVKKETKWPNGQVHTVENEQFANALMLFYEKVRQTDVPLVPSCKENTEHEITVPANLSMSNGYDAFEPDVKRSNRTHQWQAFLFDTEFQCFLKGLLGLCRMTPAGEPSGATNNAGVPAESDNSWKASIVQILVSFFFDVLLYSSEQRTLGEWVRMLENIMATDILSARAFLVKLASKTREVSGNWLRTYLVECPEQAVRAAAVRIFSCAIISTLAVDTECEKLQMWAKAWNDQVSSIKTIKGALPCRLEGEWAMFEDTRSDSYSACGVILSFVNILIEASPRNWRYSPDLNDFIRNLACVKSDESGEVLRKAIIECLIPPRLICTIVRERAPVILRASFPGASVAAEVAETQIRPEANPSPQLMSMGGNHSMNPPETNYNRGVNSPLDYFSLFEAVGSLLGIKGIVQAPILTELDDGSRGRLRIGLSEGAVRALEDVFVEYCTAGAPGLGKHEIEKYLQRCGIDSVNFPSQKIDELISKYPTPDGNHIRLEGFLSFYQESVQTNEMRVRLDLHTNGFRPDLTRRPLEARVADVQGRVRPLQPAESVALDVACTFKDNIPSTGRFADRGLQCFSFYLLAYSANESLAEYIVAAVTCNKEDNHGPNGLLVNTLRAIYTAPSSWVGNETLSAATMVLKVIAAVPDNLQANRIHEMMHCNEPPQSQHEFGLGLLSSAGAFYAGRQSQNYSNEYSYAYDRYVGILKDLMGVQSVYMWMSANRSQWAFMERDLLDSQYHTPRPGQQIRTDVTSRRDDSAPGVPMEHATHSDSEGMPGIHDSEDDDEDSRFEELDSPSQFHGPGKVVVEGAGNPVVNGVYTRGPYFERASSYTKKGQFKGNPCVFHLFQCNVSNNTKHWYLSIVPPGRNPGTNSDTDFYSAPVDESCLEFPPLTGWTKSNEGVLPPPTLIFKDVVMPDEPETERVYGGNDYVGAHNGNSYV